MYVLLTHLLKIKLLYYIISLYPVYAQHQYMKIHKGMSNRMSANILYEFQFNQYYLPKPKKVNDETKDKLETG